ncbi:hypothetical protein AHAS_Ahas01G0140000 [Arachis hypogaea]
MLDKMMLLLQPLPPSGMYWTRGSELPNLWISILWIEISGKFFPRCLWRIPFPEFRGCYYALRLMFEMQKWRFQVFAQSFSRRIK